MSNLSDIGFPVKGDQDVGDLIMHVVGHVREIVCPQGLYLKFSDPSGAEIYLQCNKDQELIGFNPHFAGKSRRIVSLTQSIERDSSELDGGFRASADSSDEAGERSEEYPFVFDVPDFRTVGETDFPSVREIQLTAFASNDLKIYQNEAEFRLAQGLQNEFAGRSFAQAGLSQAENGAAPIEPPRPFGVFSGEIKEFELKTNQFSGEKFYWFLVETPDGEADVVADVKLVPTGPKIGGILSGQFWLSGRLREAQESSCVVNANTQKI